MLLNPLFSASL